MRNETFFLIVIDFQSLCLDFTIVKIVHLLITQHFSQSSYGLCFHVSFCVPAGGSMPWNYLTKAPIQAIVWLQSAGTLTRPAIHGAVAWITQTLCLIGPTVNHAAWKLIAGQELAGVCLVSWNQQRGEDADESSSKWEERGRRNSVALTLIQHPVSHCL